MRIYERSRKPTITQIVSRRLNAAVHVACVVRKSRVFCTLLQNIVVYNFALCMPPKDDENDVNSADMSCCCCNDATTHNNNYRIDGSAIRYGDAGNDRNGRRYMQISFVGKSICKIHNEINFSIRNY